MYLKVMEPENVPDSDSRKSFRVFAGLKWCRFDRDHPSNMPHAMVEYENGHNAEVELDGNAYLLNDAGKTIAAFSVSPPPEAAEAA